MMRCAKKVVDSSEPTPVLLSGPPNSRMARDLAICVCRQHLDLDSWWGRGISQSGPRLPRMKHHLSVSVSLSLSLSLSYIYTKWYIMHARHWWYRYGYRWSTLIAPGAYSFESTQKSKIYIVYGGPSVACFLFTSRRNLRHVAGGSTVVPERGTTEFLRRASTLHRVPVVNAHATRTNDSLIHDSARSAFILHRPFIYLLLVCHFPRRSNHDFFAKLISLQLWVFPRISCMVGIDTTPSRVLIIFEDAARMKGNMNSVHTAGKNDT
jgi:hypothetical protein